MSAKKVPERDGERAAMMETSVAAPRPPGTFRRFFNRPIEKGPDKKLLKSARRRDAATLYVKSCGTWALVLGLARF